MISVRLNSEDEKIIKKFSKSKNMTVSEFVRSAALKAIEDEYDIDAVKEYLENKDGMKFYTSEEVEKELGLNV